LSVVVAAILATTAISYRQLGRLSRDEGRARVERALARALDAERRGLDPRLFELGTGVELDLRSREQVESTFGDPRVPLWRAALEGDTASAVLPDGLGAVAVGPAAEAGGTILEARIPSAILEAPRRLYLSRVGAAAALVLAASAGIAIALARRLAAPLAELAASARRMESGDLSEPVRDPGGVETGALAATLERMRVGLGEAHDELARRGTELESIVGGIAEGVVAVDRDRRIRFLSPPAASLLGVDPEAARGRFCGDVLRPAPVGGVRPCEEACPILHARYLGSARAIETVGAGGAARQLVVSSSGGSALQTVILREESPVESARRARDAAVAELAHELQTPLAAQSASLELLRERLARADSPALDLVLALETGTARLRRLIDNLLESVRIESGQLAIRRVPVDLEEVVEDAVAMTRPLLERRGQRIELDLPHPLGGTVGDPQRLTQVLVNLLANASKFGPEGSIVRVGAGAGAGVVELWVEDDGPGFPAGAEGGTAAAPFRRGGAEPRQAGSGLGLWICRSILERHGGALRVERGAPGRTRVVASLRGDVAA
jgi:signal transduction histidine kinase/HAMP domain-containing protein